MKNHNLNNRLHFPATLRNRSFIADIFRNYITEKGLILEIASGSGQHGVFFQKLFPSIIWQTSDPDPENRKSIVLWIDHHGLASQMPKPIDITWRKGHGH